MYLRTLRSISLVVIVASLGWWTPSSLSASGPPSVAGSGQANPKLPFDPRDDGSEYFTKHIPLAKRADRVGALARGEAISATLSGTLIRGSAVTTTWALYPGACVERALGTWTPKSSPVADSLQFTPGFPNSGGYAAGQPGSGGANSIAYTREDASRKEILWHVANGSEPATQRPAIISGPRMLWCGKYDATWISKVGYPNRTDQILYIDTGAHAGPYYLMFDGNISCETDFDWVSFIGGGDGARDPLGSSRQYFQTISRSGSGGPTGRSVELVWFTGNMAGGDFPASGQREARTGTPVTGHYRIGPIDPSHRAIYVLFHSDDAFSSEDGEWVASQGQQLDNIDTSDNGAIYTDQVPIGEVDAYWGMVVIGTPENPIISCRVYPGIGEFWQLASGATTPTSDLCSPQKTSATDLFLQGGDPVDHTGVNGQYSGVITCAFPVPPGTGAIIATWDAYANQTRNSGYVVYVASRHYKAGAWSRWKWTGGVGAETWVRGGGELSEAVGADSVQLGCWVYCAPYTFGGSCDESLVNPALFDNLSLQFITGVAAPAPSFGWISGPRPTFIDGTIHGTNCTISPCWPGLTGTNAGGVDDNWNDEDGFDIVFIRMSSSLRPQGMGINWRTSFHDPASSRSGYNPAYDVPRMIYRLFDPRTLSWSPWDSTEILTDVRIIDADGAGPAPPESTVFNFVLDWPPREKVAAGASLPGGFTINGVGAYAGLSFLPRGTRMQCYLKAVDINGGVTYKFSQQWTTVDDGELPNLPCHASPGCVGPKPPGIGEWSVLPGAYPPGPPGSLLAGRTSTPILVLDDAYSPVAQALRALGVRADRHPALQFGGHDPTDFGRDHWPNLLEYPIIDSLAAWYRIVIVPMYGATDFEGSTFGYNTTARDLSEWLEKDTGSNGGDRCLFLDGNDALLSLLTGGRSTQVRLVQEGLGVASATETWSGASVTPYPNIDNRFAAPGSGPGLAASGAFAHPIDGGCPDPLVAVPARFDALTPVTTSDVQSALFYPNGQVAGVSRMREIDAAADKDRLKTLAHGFSIEAIRDPAIPPTSPSYTHSGVAGRAQVLYKFLTACRGARTSAPSDTGKCWPCPTPGTTFSIMQSDWAGLASGFRTTTYGPLYPIQAGTLATGVVVETGASESAPRANRIDSNYPNPFSPQTAIRFTSASAGWVDIRIFSISGRLVRVLRAAAKAGVNETRWDVRGNDGQPVASGVYFYKIVFPNGQSLRAPNHLVIVK